MDLALESLGRMEKMDPAWRRLGLGTGLLQRLMVFLTKEGITTFGVRYRANPDLSTNFEPILMKLGWSPPISDYVLLQGNSDQLAAIDWADRYPISEPYRLCRWHQLTSKQQNQAAGLDAPAELQPPADPQGLEPMICLALLHQATPVGWLLAYRTGVNSIRYSSLFVAKTHRSRARGLALLSEGFRRQHAAAIPVARAAVDHRHTSMLRLLKRHLSPHLSTIGRSCSSQAPVLRRNKT